MCNIDEIMEMLDWNNSEEVQKKGIELARNVRTIGAFILPMHLGKGVWENCAKVLTDRSDNELNPYLFRLLEWLEDMNVPGAEIILKRLINYDEMDMLNFCIKCCVEKAVACGGVEDMILLDNISELLENEKLKEALSIYSLDTLNILQKHYYNRGWWDEE